ncbi:TLP1 [Symbiodinium sp. KB8]|nr:TLP1 [Symbiodinium sp. KB8]
MQNCPQPCFNKAAANPLAGLKHSVLLADPCLGDSIIIGCSDGFEELSGFTRMELLGQPCRFMIEGCFNQPSLMEAMNSAIATGDEFLGVTVSKRKSGEQFSNLLHMFSILCGGKRYLLLVQADVSNTALNLADPAHVSHLRQVAVSILSADVDTWVVQQLAEFYRLRLRKPVDMSQLLSPQMQQQELPATSPDSMLMMHQVPPSPAAAQFVPPQQQFSKEIPNNMMQMPPMPNLQGFRNELQAPAAAPCSAGPAQQAQLRGYGTNEQWHVALQPQDNQQLPTYPGRPVQSGFLEHDVDVDQRFEMGPDEEEEGIPSLGSSAHPDKCTECQFHFFSASGCRMGADCRFCHLFHPRKCQRKNRKILKRLQVNGREEQSPLPDASSFVFIGAEQGTVKIKTFRYLKLGVIEALGAERSRDEAAEKQVESLRGDAARAGRERSKRDVGKVVGAERWQGDAAGPPHGRVILDQSCAASPFGRFVPFFLTFQQASPRDLYTVTMSAEAETLHGASMGPLPVAKCCMSIRIVQPRASTSVDSEEENTTEQFLPIEKKFEVPLVPDVMPMMTAHDRQAGG